MSTLEYTRMDSIVSLTNDRATCILVIRYESACIVLGDYSIVHHAFLTVYLPHHYILYWGMRGAIPMTMHLVGDNPKAIVI